MHNPTRGIGRVARIAALGGSCAVVTAVGHSAGHGHTAALGLFLVTILMLVGAAFVTSREMSLTRLLAFAGTSQVLGHVMLALATPSHGSPSAQPIQTGLTRHDLHGLAASELSASGGSSMIDRLDMSSTMVFAHLLAAVCIAFLLRTGERALFATQRLLVQIVRFVLGAPVALSCSSLPVQFTSRFVVHAAARRPTLERLAAVVIRRGPPATSALSI